MTTIEARTSPEPATIDTHSTNGKPIAQESILSKEFQDIFLFSRLYERHNRTLPITESGVISRIRGLTHFYNAAQESGEYGNTDRLDQELEVSQRLLEKDKEYYTEAMFIAEASAEEERLLVDMFGSSAKDGKNLMPKTALEKGFLLDLYRARKVKAESENPKFPIIFPVQYEKLSPGITQRLTPQRRIVFNKTPIPDKSSPQAQENRMADPSELKRGETGWTGRNC